MRWWRLLYIPVTYSVVTSAHRILWPVDAWLALTVDGFVILAAMEMLTYIWNPRKNDD